MSNKVTEYLKTKTCMILEPSGSFSRVLQETLKSISDHKLHIIVVKKWDEAKEVLKNSCPEIIITEYELGGHYGLDLVKEQEKYQPDPDGRIFFVVTGNSSDSAVAQAAEEDIDAYILKPFSTGDLEARLKEVVLKKLNPSEYIKKIRAGKELLKSKEFEAAEKEFIDAKDLDSKPSLAYYYAGRISYTSKKFPIAIERYQKGLEFAPLHYKCLLGEFDSLFDTKDYKGAYKSSKLIAKHFPVTPLRLGKFYISAVYTYNFKDLDKYFEIFLKYDRRPPELVKIMSAALYTAGKYFLQKNESAPAIDYFDAAIRITAKDVDFMEKVILLLLEHKIKDAAQKFYLQYPRDLVGGQRHARMGFLVDKHFLPVSKLIEQGKKIVSDGHANEQIYIDLVDIMLSVKKNMAAEAIITKAVKDFPDLRKKLYDKLEAATK